MDSHYQTNDNFVSANGRANITVVLLAIGIGINVLSILLGFYLNVFQPDGAFIGEIDQADVGIGTFVIWLQDLTLFSKPPVVILTAIFFLIWLHRVTKNLNALESRNNYTPGWAVAFWFIPFISLYMPCKTIKDVWEKSEPSIQEQTEYWHKFSPTWLFGWWWALWLISSIVWRIAVNYSNKVETTDQWFILTKIIMIFDILSILAAFFCILIVQGIDKRQLARSNTLNVDGSSMPPAPPVFQQTL